MADISRRAFHKILEEVPEDLDDRFSGWQRRDLGCVLVIERTVLRPKMQFEPTYGKRSPSSPFVLEPYDIRSVRTIQPCTILSLLLRFQFPLASLLPQLPRPLPFCRSIELSGSWSRCSSYHDQGIYRAQSFSHLLRSAQL